MNNLKCLLKLGSLIQKPRVAIMRSFNIEDKHSIDIDNFLMAKSCMDAIVSSSKILCSLTVSFSLLLCNVLHTKVQRPFAVFHWLLIHPAFTIIDMCLLQGLSRYNCDHALFNSSYFHHDSDLELPAKLRKRLRC